MKDLFKGIKDQFDSDSNLNTNFTAIYISEADPKAVYPYLVFDLVSNVEDFTSSDFIETAIIQFNIFDDSRSVENICDLYNYLKGDTSQSEGYDFFELTVQNYNTLCMIRDTSILTKVKQIWQYNVTYKVMLDYTGTATTARFYGNLYNLIGI